MLKSFSEKDDYYFTVNRSLIQIPRNETTELILIMGKKNSTTQLKPMFQVYGFNEDIISIQLNDNRVNITAIEVGTSILRINAFDECSGVMLDCIIYVTAVNRG